MDEPAGGSPRDGALFDDIRWDDDEFITETQNFIEFMGEDPNKSLENWSPSYVRKFFGDPLPDQPAGVEGPVVEQQTSPTRTTSAASQINVQQQSHVAVSVPVKNKSSSEKTSLKRPLSLSSLHSVDERIIRRCSHCGASQWRMGASGPNTHCDACGLRYNSGRLDPPITSDQPSGTGGPVYIDNVEQQTSAAASQVIVQHEETQQSPDSVLEKGKNKSCDTDGKTKKKKCCSHCQATRTTLWRHGPSGQKTLCNACGLRYKKSGRLCPEYRPAASPTFDSSKHSNSHRGL